MGLGIYNAPAIEPELDLHIASGYAEAEVLWELLLVGGVVSALLSTYSGTVGVLWGPGIADTAVLTAAGPSCAIEMLVRPMNSTRVTTTKSAGRPVDPRGPVSSPDVWFTTTSSHGSATSVDVFNTEVLDMNVRW